MMGAARRLIAAAVLLGALTLGAGSANAATESPGWKLDSVAAPTNFSAGHNDAYEVYATNVGSLATDETHEIVVSDTLPSGLAAQEVEFFSSGISGNIGFLCETSGNVVRCRFPLALAPDETLKMVVDVTLAPGVAGTLENAVAVTGGGAPEASLSTQNQVASAAAGFGAENFDFYIDGLDGKRDTQAGDHPYELTTTIDLNSLVSSGKELKSVATSVDDLKDVVVDLPLGFVGSTLAAPECTLEQLSSERGCPPATMVGHIRTEPESVESVNSPIWNLVPEYGVPAEFGYLDNVKNSHVFYVHVVPTPAGYVLQVTNPDIPQIILAHIAVTFYGDPAARVGSGGAQVPFFTNPTGCAAGPLRATVHMDSWQHPGRFDAEGAPDFTDRNWVFAESVSPPVTGCNELQFTPELKAQPTTTMADTPSGLEFELKSPQTEDFGTHATSELKRAAVTLPEGFTVDPSAGDGLAACSEAQIGWLGGTTRNFDPAPPACPETSKIGSLELSSPLIPGVLNGAMYLARQEENPFGSLLAAYVVVDDPVTGVLIKIAGEFMPDPRTGRLTAVFDENPQLPFSDLKLHFFGGPRAELATPESCGTFTTTSELTPWSAPDSGPVATPFDSFAIQSGCVSGFAPGFTAGSTNLQAGAYSPFVLSFSRSDTDQELAGLSVSLPPGLLAKVGDVPLCSDADANAGTCPASSQIGTVETGVGPGPNPLFVGGRAYLTGPYKGGPYGVAVVVPAVAGPFDFGTVVVRQSLRIDPHDAHVIAVSDPFPTIIDGIPLRLRRVDVRLERPQFTFNPTNCGKLAFAGALGSTAGASSPLGASFQVTNCAVLGFKPQFKVSTSGRTSRANGASLTVKLAYPKGAFGSEANVAKVKVELPKQLPSRLSTLQKACTAATFEANPAKCPAASIVGHATATTPVLAIPLTGPAYFVSHGGEAFPSLIIVLEGGGITVDLVGSTFISKSGITSSTFKTVPDVPVGSFELTLPEEPFSALSATVDLCRKKLRMPTEFVAQNGALLKQDTAISVSGCTKHRAKRVRHRRKRRGRTRGSSRRPDTTVWGAPRKSVAHAGGVTFRASGGRSDAGDRTTNRQGSEHPMDKLTSTT